MGAIETKNLIHLCILLFIIYYSRKKEHSPQRVRVPRAQRVCVVNFVVSFSAPDDLNVIKDLTNALRSLVSMLYLNRYNRFNNLTSISMCFRVTFNDGVIRSN